MKYYIFLSALLTILFNTVLIPYGYSALPIGAGLTSTAQEVDSWLVDFIKWGCIICFTFFTFRAVFFKGGWLFALIPLFGWILISARKAIFDWASTIM
ncbi:MAG: hypothetical protein LBH40_01445 [Alphaproteobacteria bacterium]|jgi:hypothetical protein|nr:hypothetical protein [Alphaproteobacteria bacterium]